MSRFRWTVAMVAHLAERRSHEPGDADDLDATSGATVVTSDRDQAVAAIETDVDALGPFSAFARSLTVHFDNDEDLISAEAPTRLMLEKGPASIAEMQALGDGG